MLRFERDEHGLEAALERVAHRCERDADGRIIKLDLQWLILDDQLADEIGTLPHLRELRYSAMSDTSFDFMLPRSRKHMLLSKRILRGLLKQKELTTLELPTEAIDSDIMQEIGTLLQLRRLQLPSLFDDLADPAQIPMPFERTEFFSRAKVGALGELPTAGVLRTYYHGAEYQRLTTTLNSSDLIHLDGLRHLQYLFVPGFMLDAISLPTVLGFDELEELHAPFSNLDATGLQSLAQLKRLKAISIGTKVSEIEQLASLQALSGLEKLQLFVYFGETAKPDSEQVKLRVEKMFPGVELWMHSLATPAEPFLPTELER